MGFWCNKISELLEKKERKHMDKLGVTRVDIALWKFNIAMENVENGHRNSKFSHLKEW